MDREKSHIVYHDGKVFKAYDARLVAADPKMMEHIEKVAVGGIIHRVDAPDQLTAIGVSLIKNNMAEEVQGELSKRRLAHMVENGINACGEETVSTFQAFKNNQINIELGQQVGHQAMQFIKTRKLNMAGR